MSGAPPQQPQFARAGDRDAPARRIARVWKEESDSQRRHDCQIHQVRREGGQRKAPVRVQHAHMQSEQRHEQQIGERDARQADGQREFLRPVAKAWRKQRDKGRGEQKNEDEQNDLRDEQERIDLAREVFRRFRAFLLKRHGIGRHEGGVKRAFAEDRPETVGKALGDEKGVRNGAGAHDRRLPGARQEACQTREQLEAAHRAEMSDHEWFQAVWRLRRRMPCGLSPRNRS